MPIRLILIWGVIALVLVVGFVALQPVGNDVVQRTPELSYSAMLERVEEGEVATARTKGSMILLGLNNSRQYVAYVPDGAMADTVRQLRAAGVEIRATPPPSGPTLGDILLGLLPMLLLIGAWYFFMRQLQAKGQDSGK